MKKTWKVVSGIMLSTALLFGCSNEGEIKNVTLSQEEQESFMASFLELSNKETEPSELVVLLNKNIAGLDQKKASDSVDALLYAVYQYREEMNSVAQGLQPVLEGYEKKGLDLNKKEDIEKVDDKVAKAFLEQAHSRYLKVEKENELYVTVADFDKVLSQYEKYMADDLKAMVKFSKEEYEVKYYNEETQTINLDVVAERIVLMENLAKKHPNSYYTNWFNQSKDFYYQLYFGMNGNAITKKDQTLLPDVESHFHNMLTKHEGTEFAKNINRFFDEYKKNGNKVNDNVVVFLLDLTKKDHETIKNDGSVESGSTESNQVKEAIKKAIDEKKSETSGDKN